MRMLLIGGGFVIGGVFMSRVALGYFRGTGIEYTPAGTPAAGVGLGPSLASIGLFMLMRSVPNSTASYVASVILLGLFFLGGVAGSVILLTKPLFGWPRYGQWPDLLGGKHEGRSRRSMIAKRRSPKA
jgi:hypothetical protein